MTKQDRIIEHMRDVLPMAGTVSDLRDAIIPRMPRGTSLSVPEVHNAIAVTRRDPEMYGFMVPYIGHSGYIFAMTLTADGEWVLDESSEAMSSFNIGGTSATKSILTKLMIVVAEYTLAMNHTRKRHEKNRYEDIAETAKFLAGRIRRQLREMEADNAARALA